MIDKTQNIQTQHPKYHTLLSDKPFLVSQLLSTAGARLVNQLSPSVVKYETTDNFKVFGL